MSKFPQTENHTITSFTFSPICISTRPSLRNNCWEVFSYELGRNINVCRINSDTLIEYVKNWNISIQNFLNFEWIYLCNYLRFFSN